jgi:hypothetical protein
MSHVSCLMSHVSCLMALDLGLELMSLELDLELGRHDLHCQNFAPCVPLGV